MIKKPDPELLIWLLTVALVTVYRLAPHPWNVTPAGALFVLGGLCFPSRRLGWMLPFAALLISDLLIYATLHQHMGPARLIDYAGFGLVYVLGRAQSNRGALGKGLSVVLAPFIFFLVSNFGVWVAGHLYPRTLGGLMDCYVAAIPFFRGTIAGDWLFAASGLLAIQGIPRLPSFAKQPPRTGASTAAFGRG